VLELFLRGGPAPGGGRGLERGGGGGRIEQVVEMQRLPGGERGAAQEGQQFGQEAVEVGGAGEQVEVVADLNCADVEQHRPAVAFGAEQRGGAGQAAVFARGDEGQRSVGPFAAAAGLPPGGQVFVAQERHVAGGLFQQGVPLVVQTRGKFGVKGEIHTTPIVWFDGFIIVKTVHRNGGGRALTRMRTNGYELHESPQRFIRAIRVHSSSFVLKFLPM